MDDMTKRLIDAGLQPAVQQAGSPVEMINMPDGNGGTVPVSVGQATVRILDGIYQRLTEIMLRLDAIHHHDAWGNGSNARSSCMVCQAQKQAAAQIQQKIDDGTLLDGDADVIQLKVPVEESQENGSDSSGEVPTSE